VRVIVQRQVRVTHYYGPHVRSQGLYQWRKLLAGTVEAGQQYSGTPHFWLLTMSLSACAEPFDTRHKRTIAQRVHVA
jgi:hypothetical protein